MPHQNQFKPLKKVFHQEQKKLIGGFTAFSVASLLLFIQGSISGDSAWNVVGLLLLAASIPAGVLSYLVALKIIESDKVPCEAHKKAEDLFNFTLSMSACGFMALLAGSSLILAGVVSISFVIFTIHFSRIMDLWPIKDELEPAEDCPEEVPAEPQKSQNDKHAS